MGARPVLIYTWNNTKSAIGLPKKKMTDNPLIAGLEFTSGTLIIPPNSLCCSKHI
jgi:hypothetical protein